MKDIIELSNERIVELAPAAGATAPVAKASNRYSFVPTLTAVDLLRDAGWVPVEARQSRIVKVERAEFSRHMIRFSMPGLAMNGERVDLSLYNSHDLGSAFQLIATIWRKICGNGMMTNSKLFNFIHKHIGFDPETFVISARTIANESGKLAVKVEDLKTIEMTPDERGIFAQAAHQLVYDEPEKAPVIPEALLVERRMDDKGKDLWTTFNVVQENIMKGGLRGTVINKHGRRQRYTTRPVTALDKDVKLNKALWTLTEKMAELKAA